MSFSFTASGTKAQTLVTLGTVAAGHDPAAATIADLLALMVTAGPDESSDGKPVPYEATAFGHSARSLSRDNWPSLNVSLSCTTGAKPADG